MALGATIYNFEVQLSNVDRGVYEKLSIKAARHPSESDEYLVTRVLAYCLEYTEGIAFSKGGLSNPDEPPIAVRDLTGVLQAWIDIGLPDAARLHRASKAAPRVAVYTHRDPDALRKNLDGARIHRQEALELYAFGRDLISALVKNLERRTAWDVSLTDGSLFVGVGTATLAGEVTALSPPAPRSP
jgi:uncharacterized protein YaeQ